MRSGVQWAKHKVKSYGWRRSNSLWYISRPSQDGRALCMCPWTIVLGACIVCSTLKGRDTCFEQRRCSEAQTCALKFQLVPKAQGCLSILAQASAPLLFVGVGLGMYCH